MAHGAKDDQIKTALKIIKNYFDASRRADSALYSQPSAFHKVSSSDIVDLLKAQQHFGYKLVKLEC